MWGDCGRMQQCFEPSARHAYTEFVNQRAAIRYEGRSRGPRRSQCASRRSSVRFARAWLCRLGLRPRRRVGSAGVAAAGRRPPAIAAADRRHERGPARPASASSCRSPSRPGPISWSGRTGSSSTCPRSPFHLPTETGRKREGLIASFRYGLFAPGRSRVVIDLAQPAIVSPIEVKSRPPDGAARLDVELDPGRPGRLPQGCRRERAGGRPRDGRRAEPSRRQARRSSSSTRAMAASIPGAAAAGGMLEKDIVFAFAQKLQRRLEADGRYRVVMTRDEDVFVPLGERVRIARAAQADLFISIHADTISGGQDVRGLHHLYRLGAGLRRRFRPPRRPREQGRPGRRRRGGRRADDDVTDILQDLTLRETRAFSHGFAEPPRRRARRGRSPEQESAPRRPASGSCGRPTCPRSWSSSATCRAARTSTS